MCRAEMERAAADRAFDALHEKQPFHDGTFTRWAKEFSAEFPYHFRDGHQTYVSEIDVNPGDPFTTERDAAP